MNVIERIKKNFYTINSEYNDFNKSIDEILNSFNLDDINALEKYYKILDTLREYFFKENLTNNDIKELFEFLKRNNLDDYQALAVLFSCSYPIVFLPLREYKLNLDPIYVYEPNEKYLYVLAFTPIDFLFASENKYWKSCYTISRYSCNTNGLYFIMMGAFSGIIYALKENCFSYNPIMREPFDIRFFTYFYRNAIFKLKSYGIWGLWGFPDRVLNKFHNIIYKTNTKFDKSYKVYVEWDADNMDFWVDKDITVYSRKTYDEAYLIFLLHKTSFTSSPFSCLNYYNVINEIERKYDIVKCYNKKRRKIYNHILGVAGFQSISENIEEVISNLNIQSIPQRLSKMKSNVNEFIDEVLGYINTFNA